MRATAVRRRVRLLARCSGLGGLRRGPRGHGVRLDPGATSGSIHHGGLGDRRRSAGGAPTAEQNILLLGVDSRTDPQGNPLPPDAARRAARRGHQRTAGTPPTRSSSSTSPRVAAARPRSRCPRDSFVQLADGYGTHKINSAYSRAAAYTTDSLTSGDSASGAPTSPFAPQAGPSPSADDPAVRRAALAAGARTTVDTVAGAHRPADHPLRVGQPRRVRRRQPGHRRRAGVPARPRRRPLLRAGAPRPAPRR